MIDWNKLTALPWASVKQMGGSLVPTGKFILAHGLTALAIFESEEDCDATALALNALGVMTRRGWFAHPVVTEWDGTVKAGAKWKLAVHIGPPDDVKVFQASDPFTVLVQADEWFKENVENKSGSSNA